MKGINKYIISLTIACFIGINGHGQNPMTLYYMETIPQLTRINPAMQPRTNGFLELVSINTGFQSDLAFKDLLQKHGNQWYLPFEEKFDFGKLYNRIGKSYDLRLNTEVSALSFGFKVANGYFTFSISQKIEAQLGVPSDFFKIADVGFPDGSKMDWAPLRFNAMAYKQFSIGYSFNLSEELKLGVNVRPLFGQAAAVWKPDKFDVTTGIEEWHFVTKGNVFVSGPITLNENSDKEYPEYDLFDEFKEPRDNAKLLQKYVYGFSNPGVALDFGAVYELDRDWSFSAALNNFGFIMWRSDLNSIKYEGEYTYEGIEVDEPGGLDWSNLLSDMLEELPDHNEYETGQKNFTTLFSPSLYLGAQYNVTNTISLGLLSRTVFHQYGVGQHFSLTGNMLFYNFASLSLSLNQNIRGGTYGGLGFSLYLGPLQIFAVSDFIPLRYTNATIMSGDDKPTDAIGDVAADNKGTEIAFLPVRLKEASVMFGINILFGKKGFVDKPMLDRAYY